MKKTMYALVTQLLLTSVGSSASAEPSFDCATVRDGSIEQVICSSSELSILDRELAATYKRALAVAEDVVDSTLGAEQRGWIKARNACWKSRDAHTCVTKSYQRRIAELRARYRLYSPTATVFYQCGDSPANEVVVSYFATSPQTAIAERGDNSFLLFKDEKTNVFRGPNEKPSRTLDKITASFSHGGPAVQCTARKPVPARMHPSWDVDGDGINDCEKDGSCDHTVNYSLPRKRHD